MKHVSEVDLKSLIKPNIVPDQEFNCSDCRDVGWVKGSDRMRRCEKCLPQRIKNIIVKTCGARYKNCSFDNFIPIDGVEKIGNSEAKKIKIPGDIDHNSGYVFYGNNGVGKTYLSVALFKEKLTEGKEAAWLTEEELLRGAQQYLYNLDGRQLNKDWMVTIFDNPENLEFVVLDDIGKTPVSESRRFIIYQFIENIYKHNIQLIITTNKVDFSTFLGGEMGTAILSRLRGMCKIVKFVAKDGRLLYNKI